MAVWRKERKMSECHDKVEHDVSNIYQIGLIYRQIYNLSQTLSSSKHYNKTLFMLQV